MINNAISNTVGFKQITPRFVIAGSNVENQWYVGFYVGDTKCTMGWFRMAAFFSKHEERDNQQKKIKEEKKT